MHKGIADFGYMNVDLKILLHTSEIILHTLHGPSLLTPPSSRISQFFPRLLYVPGSPGEFHPEAPTEPDMKLSPHPALITPSVDLTVSRLLLCPMAPPFRLA